ncbi:MAG: FecR family protein [bacterium]
MAKCDTRSKILSTGARGKTLVAGLTFLAGLAFLAGILLPGLPLPVLAASIPVGTIDMVEGLASVRHDLQKTANTIQQGDKVYPRDEITTEKGAKVKISFINRSTIHLGGGSCLIVKAVLYAPQKSLNQSFFKLSVGKIRAVVDKFSSPDDKFEVETKTAVAGVVGTEEIVSASEQPETGQDITQVVCQSGHLVVRSSDPDIPGEVYLESMEQSWIRENEIPQDKMKITPEELEGLIRETTMNTEWKAPDKAPAGQAGQAGQARQKNDAAQSEDGDAKSDESKKKEAPEEKKAGLPAREELSSEEGQTGQTAGGQSGPAAVTGQSGPAVDQPARGEFPLEGRGTLSLEPDQELGQEQPPSERPKGLEEQKVPEEHQDGAILQQQPQTPEADAALPIDLMEGDAGVHDVGLTDFGTDFEETDRGILPLSEDTILKEIIPDIENTYRETLKTLPDPPDPPR